MSLKILLVDDHEVVRMGLKSLLSHNSQFQVVAEAGNASQALEQVARGSPDVVIMDIRLPGKSGIEATREIVSKYPKIKVIMLTSYAEDELLFDAIAAGEVVERPASVVKELIENSIDAGASALSVEIREGGTTLIRVSDNGSEMSHDDALLAVERFATTKISTDADLRAVKTLGFRGEALPSILPAFIALDPRELITTLLQEHERHRTLDGDALRDKLAAKAACVSAIQAGDALSSEQQQALLDELLQAYAPATCPHGRPVFVTLRLEELDRRFLRR